MKSVLKQFRNLTIGLVLTGLASACAQQPDEVTVKHVLDGDTVILDDRRTVRLLGINTPEKEFDDRPAQPLSLESTLLLKELVTDRAVRLTVGKEEKDKYDRTLGYLDLPDGTDVQQRLLERGYAFVVAFPPDISRLDKYLKAEKKARQSKSGVWSHQYYVPQDMTAKAPVAGGFGLFQGKVTKVKRSKKNVRLTLGKSMVLGIRHAAWEQYWNVDAEDLLGKTIIARGWARASRKKKLAYLRIRHPAMMEIK